MLVLRQGGTGGTFGGWVSSSFTYAGGGQYTLSGGFTGPELVVNSNGTLNLTGATSREEGEARTVLDLRNTDVDVAAGATLVLGGGSNNKVNRVYVTTTKEVEGGEQQQLTLNGTLTLRGTLLNQVEGDLTLGAGATLNYDNGGAGRNALTGVLTLDGGTLTWQRKLEVEGLERGTSGMLNGADSPEFLITGNVGRHVYDGVLGNIAVTMKGSATQAFSGSSYTNAFIVEDGTIEFSGAVDLSGATLTLKNGVFSFTGGSGIVDTLTTGDGGDKRALVLGGGELSVAKLDGSLTSLTLEGGSRLDLGDGNAPTEPVLYDLGTVILGGNATLGGLRLVAGEGDLPEPLPEPTQLHFTGFDYSRGGNLTIELSGDDLGTIARNRTGYQLFQIREGDLLTDKWCDGINIEVKDNSAGWNCRVDSSGYLWILDSTNALTFDGFEYIEEEDRKQPLDSMTWISNDPDLEWQVGRGEGQAPVWSTWRDNSGGQNVILTLAEEWAGEVEQPKMEMEVSLVGGVSVHDMKVEGATFTFTHESDVEGSLSVTGNLSIAGNGGVVVKGSTVTVDGELTGVIDEDGELRAGSMIVGAGGRLETTVDENYTSRILLEDTGTLQAKGQAKVKVTGVENRIETFSGDGNELHLDLVVDIATGAASGDGWTPVNQDTSASGNLYLDSVSVNKGTLKLVDVPEAIHVGNLTVGNNDPDHLDSIANMSGVAVDGLVTVNADGQLALGTTKETTLRGGLTGVGAISGGTDTAHAKLTFDGALSEAQTFEGSITRVDITVIGDAKNQTLTKLSDSTVTVDQGGAITLGGDGEDDVVNLEGATNVFQGTLAFTGSNNTVAGGESLTMGRQGTDETEPAVGVIEVLEGSSLTITGGLGSKTDNGSITGSGVLTVDTTGATSSAVTFGQGINVVKKGAGEQSFSADLGSGGTPHEGAITVQQGTLTFGGDVFQSGDVTLAHGTTLHFSKVSAEGETAQVQLGAINAADEVPESYEGAIVFDGEKLTLGAGRESFLGSLEFTRDGETTWDLAGNVTLGGLTVEAADQLTVGGEGRLTLDGELDLGDQDLVVNLVPGLAVTRGDDFGYREGTTGRLILNGEGLGTPVHMSLIFDKSWEGEEVGLDGNVFYYDFGAEHVGYGEDARNFKSVTVRSGAQFWLKETYDQSEVETQAGVQLGSGEVHIAGKGFTNEDGSFQPNVVGEGEDAYLSYGALRLDDGTLLIGGSLVLDEDAAVLVSSGTGTIAAEAVTGSAQGGEVLTKYGDGTLEITGSVSGLGGIATADADSSSSSDGTTSGGTLILSGSLDVGEGSFTFNADGRGDGPSSSIVVQGGLTGSANITKTGYGTLVLDGTKHELTATGSLTIDEYSTVELMGTNNFSGVVVNGVLNLAGTDVALKKLDGDSSGTIGLGGRTLTIIGTGGTFRGWIKEGQLTIDKGASQELVDGDPDNFDQVDVVDNGTLTLSAPKTTIRSLSGSGTVTDDKAESRITLIIQKPQGEKTFDGSLEDVGSITVRGGVQGFSKAFSGAFANVENVVEDGVEKVGVLKLLGADNTLTIGSLEGTLTIGDDAYEDASLTLTDQTTTSGTINGTGALTLTGMGSIESLIEGSLAITSSGTQSLTNVTAESIAVESGSMTVREGITVNRMSVSGGSVLTLENSNVRAKDESAVNGEEPHLDIEVSGAESRLAFAFGDPDLGSGIINLTLSSGATLDMSELTGRVDGQHGQEILLNTLGVTDGGNMTWADSVTGNQTVYVGTMSATGDVNLGSLASGQELHLEHLSNVTGHLTADVSGGGVVYLGEIFVAAGETGGSVAVRGGDLHVHAVENGGHGSAFHKSGSGDFNIGSKVVFERSTENNYNKLFVTFSGGLTWGGKNAGTDVLGAGELSFDGGNLAFGYDEEDSSLLKMDQSLFTSDLTSIYIDLKKMRVESLEGRGFRLGIVLSASEYTDEKAAELLELFAGNASGQMGTDDEEGEEGEGGEEGKGGLIDLDENYSFSEKSLSWELDADGNHYLTLHASGIALLDVKYWDQRWDAANYSAPNSGILEKTRFHDFGSLSGNTGSFLDSTLALADTPLLKDGGHNDANESRTVVWVDSGADVWNGSGVNTTRATIVGGSVHKTDESVSIVGVVDSFDSYIWYNPVQPADTDPADDAAADEESPMPPSDTTAHVHMLVGGSVCTWLSPSEDERGGFKGISHIQMENGAVDYIVGGNHVNNSAFTFDGDSYISVFDGSVLGSVVGGSTLTEGSASGANGYAFSGDSHVNIYAVLSNAKDAEGKDLVPTISSAVSTSESTQAAEGTAFTAVVGGNAWIGFATAEGAQDAVTTFNGNSHVLVDLVDSQYQLNGGDAPTEKPAPDAEGSFDKAIVGGNYTAFRKDENGARSSSTQFLGNTDISITANENHTFTAGINGASRSARAGEGITLFGIADLAPEKPELRSSTNITIDGGTYREAIAGGFWFEESATGDHAAEFYGDTHVTLNAGNFSRVVGGNYNLAGGAGASETTMGDTHVSVAGGTIAGGLLVGGDFYKDDNGQSNVRTGNTNVEISGGAFTDTSIVGGDYADFSGTTTGNASIQGNANLIIGSPDADNAAITIKGKLVGGSMVLDDGSGAHTVDVQSSTITVNSGTIEGVVIGGSYQSDHRAGESPAMNTLSSESIVVNLDGGVITGNVYGGHYSEVADHADALELGTVEINVNGSEVTGNIVGGNYLAAVKDSEAAPGGAVTINLNSGSVSGDVYGAGHHAAASLSGEEAALNASVAEVVVNLSSDFVFASTPETESHRLSGGFLKASGNEKLDASSVDHAVLKLTSGGVYTNLTEVTLQDFDEVVLGSTAAVSDFSLTQDAKGVGTSYRDYDADGMKVRTVDALLVRRDENAQDTARFTVNGNLDMTGAATRALDVSGAEMRVGAVSGLQTLLVHDGRMTVDSELKMVDGLHIDLENGFSSSYGKDESRAFLRAGSIDMSQFSADRKVKLTVSGLYEGGRVHEGLFYLVSGFDPEQQKGFADLFDAEFLKTLETQTNEALHEGESGFSWNGEGEGYYLDLQERAGSLVLSVRFGSPDKWFWNGQVGSEHDVEAGVWKGNTNDNWSKLDQPGAEGGETPNQAPLVNFTEGASNANDGVVRIEGTVTPGGIWVQGGEYTFRESDKGGSIELRSPQIRPGDPKEDPDRIIGKIVVGGVDDANSFASLDLQMGTTLVPEVEMRDRGVLTLSHENAIQDNTRVSFLGGKLVINEKVSEIRPDGSGELCYTGNMGARLNLADDNMLIIQVGRSYEGFLAELAAAPAGAAEFSGSGESPYAAPEQSLVMGNINTALNATEGSDGMRKALYTNGVEKSGRYKLTMAWRETGTDVTLSSNIRAQEGELAYEIGTAADGEMTLPDGVTVVRGATFSMFATAGNVTLGSFTSRDRASGEMESLIGDMLGMDDVARVSVGSADDKATYSFTGDNSSFSNGAIRLVGNGSSSLARAKDLKAIGAATSAQNAHVRLELQGRALEFDAKTETGRRGLDLYLTGMDVSGDNASFLGGYSLGNAANARINVYASTLTGDGVLANAWGKDANGEGTVSTAFHHSFTGDMADFHGKIVAGASTPGGQNSASDSSWTLNVQNVAEDHDYDFSLGGTGKVTMNAGESAITLTGQVSDLVSLENAGSGDVVLKGQNSTTGALITGDGSDEAVAGGFVLDGGATWSGTQLQGHGTFTLKQGTLTNGGSFTKDENASVVVDATGVVDVKGMKADTLGDITVHGDRGGRLSNVQGTLGTSGRRVTLVFDEANLSGVGEDADGLVSFTGKGGSLVVTQDSQAETPDSGLVLDFSEGGFVDVLKSHRVEGAQTVLHVVENGTLNLDAVDDGDLLRFLTKDSSGYGQLLSDLGFTLNKSGATSGNLLLSGVSTDVYLVLGEPGGDDDDVTVGAVNDAFDRKKAVVVDQNTGLTLRFDDNSGDEVTLHNLVGLVGSSLNVVDDRENTQGTVTVELNNETWENVDGFGYEQGQVQDDRGHVVGTGAPNGTEGFRVKGQDTTFEGTITGDAAVVFDKTGDGRLTLGSDQSHQGSTGGVNAKGSFRISDGSITLQGNGLDGNGNTMGELVFAYDLTSDERTDDNTGLTLNEGIHLTVHGMHEEGKNGAENGILGGDVTLNKDSVFTFDNSAKQEGSVLHDTTFKAGSSGGLLVVGGTTPVGDGTTAQNGSSLTLDSANSGISGVDFQVKDGAEVTMSNGAEVTNSNITVSGKRQTFNENGELTTKGSLLAMEGKPSSSSIGGAGDITVQEGGELALRGGATIVGEDKNITLTGEGSKLSVDDESSLAVSGKMSVSDRSELDLNGSSGNSIGSLTGTGVISGNQGAQLTIKGPGESSFSGTLTSDTKPSNGLKSQGGKLIVENGSRLTLDHVTMEARWDLRVNDGGYVGLFADKSSADFGNIELAGGGELELGDISGGLSGTLSVDDQNGKKGKLSINVGDGNGDVSLDDLDIVGADGKRLSAQQAAGKLEVDFTGRGSDHYNGSLQYNSQDGWYIYMNRKSSNGFLRPGMHKNVRAGANLAWNVDDPLSKASQYVNGAGAFGDLYMLFKSIAEGYGIVDQTLADAGFSNPTSMENMDRTLAAMAGSSVATLGSASLQDVKRQLESIRNRSTMLGDASVNADPGARKIHAWVNAESGYHKVDADGWAPGYTLDGWGGTLGGSVDFSASTSAGLAITAMYNNLKTDSADMGKGDIDVTYLSGYIRMQQGAWSHTFLATFGSSNVSLDRTVSYGLGSGYRTHGETDGFSTGFMYEVARTSMLNERGTVALQPVFNVQYRHSKIDGYDETGSDAGLRVNEASADMVTFGLGARMQSVISENVFGRASVFEARALVKADAGDDAGEASNSLLHGDLSQDVESASVGKIGLEIGAGLTLPIGSNGGTIFVDASAEFRSRYTNLNASAGYKISF